MAADDRMADRRRNGSQVRLLCRSADVLKKTCGCDSPELAELCDSSPQRQISHPDFSHALSSIMLPENTPAASRSPARPPARTPTSEGSLPCLFSCVSFAVCFVLFYFSLEFPHTPNQKQTLISRNRNLSAASRVRLWSHSLHIWASWPKMWSSCNKKALPVHFSPNR